MVAFFRWLVLSSLIISASARAEEFKILASIHPLGLIATEIGQGVAEVEVLLPAGASPHDFALRPTDRRRLESADLIVWVGDQTEPYLSRVVSRLDTESLPWLDEPAHAEETHEHEVSKGHDDDHGHKEPNSHQAEAASDHGHERDEHHHGDEAHPWLDPLAALNFAKALAEHLIQQLPQSSEQINANYERFAAEITKLDMRLAQQLESSRTKGFLVFHRAYDALVEHYGLNQVDALMIDPSRKPGARQMQRLREQLESGEVSCVFVEPQFSPALFDALVRNTEVKRGVLDPLATDVELAEGGYGRYLTGLAAEIQRCLD